MICFFPFAECKPTSTGCCVNVFCTHGYRIMNLRYNDGGFIITGYVAHIELGEKNPSLETLVAIANPFQVSTDDLLIDSIETTEKHNNEVDYVLLDCTPGEVKILTKNLKSLRETLREFQVK